MTKKKPIQVLKDLPTRARRADTETFEDFLAHGEQTDETGRPPLEAGFTTESVSTVLATAMLYAMLPARTMSRIQSSPSLALVVTVPGPDYVGPIAHALSSFRVWSEVLKRSGTSKSSDKPSVGNDSVGGALGAGLSVVGVSTAPERYLPSALITAADLRVELQPPSPDAVRATIKLVTGHRAGPIPTDVVQGLSFDEIVSCIRRGTKGRECVRRLKAAAASKGKGASDLADVPPLEYVCGYGEVKDRCLEMVAAVRAHRNGAPWPQAGTRFVLAGPPGCGKTTLARSIAKSLGVKLTVSSVSTWFAQTGGYLNDICRKIDEVFLEASQAGGILLLDEIDSIPNREDCDSRYRDYWTTVTNHMLMALDGAVSSPASRLIIIGATNFPSRLDPALTRPGRLDRVVHIRLPDADALGGIFRQHLNGDLADEDLGPLAVIAAGATGADVAGWVAGARMAARVAGRSLGMADVVDQIVPPDTRSPAELLAVARHEASHAVLLERQQTAEVTLVSLVAKGAFAGRTSSRLNEAANMTAKGIDALVVSTLAGRAADQLWGMITSGSAGGALSDLAQATALVAGKHATWGLGQSLLYRGDRAEALALVRTDAAFRRLVEDDLTRLYAVSQELVSRNADLIDRLAHRLMERRVLGGDEVRSIIAAGPFRDVRDVAMGNDGGVHA